MIVWNNCKQNKSKRYIVVAVDYNQEVMTKFYCKTQKIARRTFNTLVDMYYEGSIKVNCIYIFDKKKNETIEEL